MQVVTGKVERPTHVPEDLVLDFDIFNPPGLTDDVHRVWKDLQLQAPRFFWSPRNGGHWIATRGADIEAMQANWQIFSYQSITLPANPTKALPVESDPPRHTGLRAIISPLFAPDTLKRVEATARTLSIKLIDQLLPRGRCEFRSEFVRYVPISVFLSLVDMPDADTDMLLELTEIRVRNPDPQAREKAKRTLLDYMGGLIESRRSKPGTDFLSRVIHGTVDGQPLPFEDLQNMLSTVMFGGLDTVASMTGFIFRYLALYPQQRARLSGQHPIPMSAVDELIRRHGVSNTSRVIAKDVVYEGVEFRAGERITLPGSLVGLDDEKFADALTVDFDRTNGSRHSAFGNGPHRCPGANMARMEIRVMLEEWLRRIPDFSLDPQQPVVAASGAVFGMLRLPLVWPG